ncbi:MAG: hypothetical protein KBT44_04420 [Bacteroidales bacterium]|nr:hypothetical protein [Candidatus Equibacterium intestinale]
MKKICAVGLAVLLAVQASAQVFCWNLENYFDWRDDPVTLDEPFTPSGDYHWNKRKFYAKRNAIAKVIISSAGAFDGRPPAVVGLCEVENRWVLKSLLNETVLAKCGYAFLHRESPDPRGIDVALLYDKSRCTLLEGGFLKVEEFATRDIIYAKLGYAGDTLFVFLNHWPSKYGGAKVSDPKRNAVAQLLSCKVDSVLHACPDARIVLMGDFNDTPSAEVCRQLCRRCRLTNLSAGLPEGACMPERSANLPCGLPERTGIPERSGRQRDQDAIDRQPGGTSLHGHQHDENTKQRPWRDQDAIDRQPGGISLFGQQGDTGTLDRQLPGTIRYNGRWEMIDQMLVSQALAAENPRAEVYSPAFLLEPDKKFLGVKPRRTHIGPRYNGGVSDHLPVLLHF